MTEEKIEQPKPMTEAEERKYEKIFQDAMALLIKNHTFFGHILAHMVRISTNEVRTMGVSMNRRGQIILFYNTEMIKREIEENGSSLKQVTAMIQHEVYHIINEHFLREQDGKYNAWIITTIGPMRLFNVACVTGDTLITMTDGTKKQIKNIKPDEKIIGIKNDELVEGSVIGTFSKEENELIEIQTDYSKLLCSKEHRILTEDGYKRADELAVNEIVFIVGKGEDKNETEMDERRKQVLEKELWNNDKTRDCEATESIRTFSEGTYEGEKNTKAEILDTRKTGFCKEELQNNDICRDGEKNRGDILHGETLHTETAFDKKESRNGKKMDGRRKKTSEGEVARIRNRYKTIGERAWPKFISSCRNGTQIGSKADRIMESKGERMHSKELPQDISRRISSKIKSKDNRDMGLSAGKSIAKREERHPANAKLQEFEKSEDGGISLFGCFNRRRRDDNNTKIQAVFSNECIYFKHKQEVDGIPGKNGISDIYTDKQYGDSVLPNADLVSHSIGIASKEIAALSNNKIATLHFDATFLEDIHETKMAGSTYERNDRNIPIDKTIKLEKARIRKKVCIRTKNPQRLYDLITTTHSYIANDVVTHNCDVAINQYIKELPDWVLNLDSFKGLKLPAEETAEVYYKLLYKKAEENAKNLKDQLNELGDVVGVMMTSSDANMPNGMPMPGEGMPMPGVAGKGGQSEDKSETDDKEGDGDSGSGKESQKGKDGKNAGKTKKSDIDKINQWLPFNPTAFEDFLDKLRKEGKAPTSKQSGMPGDHTKWKDVEGIPKEMVDATIKQAVKEAYNKAKFGGMGIGDMPAGIDRMCKETLRPSYNFEPYLRRFVDGELFGRYEQTRKRPNRRYRWEHPGKKTETLGKIAVLADTSGSIYDEDISVFAKNLEVMSQYIQIILFDVDHGIENVREYTKRNFDKSMKGGGGTDFGAVFKIIDNYQQNKRLLDGIPKKQLLRARMLCQGIQALIIMTDGMASGCPEKEPKYSVMWALTQRCYTPPRKYGDVIYLDNKPENHTGKRNY